MFPFPKIIDCISVCTTWPTLSCDNLRLYLSFALSVTAVSLIHNIGYSDGIFTV